MKDLMTPRVIVTEYYPYSPFKVGAILEYYDAIHVYCDEHENRVPESEVEKSTVNFRKLAWYEKRDIKDMPEYVKDNFKGNIVIKVHTYMEGILDRFFVSEANKDTEYLSHLACYFPATQSEYEAYINSKI